MPHPLWQSHRLCSRLSCQRLIISIPISPPNGATMTMHNKDPTHEYSAAVIHSHHFTTDTLCPFPSIFNYSTAFHYILSVKRSRRIRLVRQGTINFGPKSSALGIAPHSFSRGISSVTLVSTLFLVRVSRTEV